MLLYYTPYMPKVNELCLNHVLKVVVKEHTPDMNSVKLYQHLKLAISVMQKGGIPHNRMYHDILVTPFQLPKSSFDTDPN